MVIMKLKWIQHNNSLRAHLESSTDDVEKNFIYFLNEEDMDPIQEWCEKHNCGYRTSFDTFRFKNEKEISMFLMRWA